MVSTSPKPMLERRQEVGVRLGRQVDLNTLVLQSVHVSQGALPDLLQLNHGLGMDDWLAVKIFRGARESSVKRQDNAPAFPET